MNGKLSFDPELLIDTYHPDRAVGYGSGVFTQEGNNSKDNMIDFIFAAENTQKWHKMNLLFNKKDYSRLVRTYGQQLVDVLQEKGAKIYYHPFIKLDEQRIKYGVISIDNVIRDCNERTNLYVAGRLHKPVETIVEHPAISKAMTTNRHHAIHTALFFLPETFTKEDLYMRIAELSYKGDSRKRAGGEPKDKVKKIVQGSKEGFEKIYDPIIATKKNIMTTLNNDKIQQTSDPRDIARLYDTLPANVRRIIEKTGPVTHFYDREQLQQKIGKGISTIVGGASLAQTGIGLVSAGLIKSIKYGRAKVKKGRAK